MKNFDVFGKDIKLNFYQKDVYKTGCGGFFTIMLVILVILFSMGEIHDYLDKGDFIYLNNFLGTMIVKEHSNYDVNP